MRHFYNELTTAQKTWIAGSTLAILILGTISGDAPINILIGTVGMFYVAVYGTGKTRWAFILGIAYVSLYTVICLQNKIYLDALQNIILIPIYFASFLHWGKHNVQPHNAKASQNALVILATALFGVGLYYVSKALHGNYSSLDAFNTACTMSAMILGYFGYSLNWCMWTANNVVSALTFGLALATPTGSITVFAMKLIFMINGIIGWITFNHIGRKEQMNGKA